MRQQRVLGVRHRRTKLPHKIHARRLERRGVQSRAIVSHAFFFAHLDVRQREILLHSIPFFHGAVVKQAPNHANHVPDRASIALGYHLQRGVAQKVHADRDVRRVLDSDEVVRAFARIARLCVVARAAHRRQFSKLSVARVARARRSRASFAVRSRVLRSRSRARSCATRARECGARVGQNCAIGIARLGGWETRRRPSAGRRGETLRLRLITTPDGYDDEEIRARSITCCAWRRSSGRRRRRSRTRCRSRARAARET